MDECLVDPLDCVLIAIFVSGEKITTVRGSPVGSADPIDEFTLLDFLNESCCFVVVDNVCEKIRWLDSNYTDGSVVS